MQPLVSIIVPTYRREKLLCETIGYLLAQDYSNRELLIVDQSSNHEPETAQYLDSIAGQIRYFHLAQPNLPAARNFGIRQSQGELIVFLDDDMVIGTDLISRLVETFSAPEVWGATGFVLSPGESDPGKYRPYMRFVSDITEFKEGKRIRIGDFIGCLMSFRRQLFDKIGYFDEWIGTQLMAAGEDFEFCQRAVLRGYGLFLNPRITTLHLGAREGGCGRRSLAPIDVERAQLRLSIYAILKNRRYSGWWGWAGALARCYRRFILNRGLFKSTAAGLVRKHTMLWHTTREVMTLFRSGFEGQHAGSGTADSEAVPLKETEVKRQTSC
jgi:GT2 family glycosyltransferase